MLQTKNEEKISTHLIITANALHVIKKVQNISFMLSKMEDYNWRGDDN